MTSQPTRVLFVAGSARSGTTVIERMLAQATGMLPLGEARFVWERGVLDNQLCGCGEPFRECPFWTRALAGVPHQPAEIGDLRHQGRRLDSNYNLPKLLSSALRSATYQRRLDEAAPRTQAMFDSLREHAGALPLIDSSKSPGYLAMLQQLPALELLVLHVVRDPRAVAFSRQRTKPRPEIHWKAQTMGETPVAKTACEWLITNMALEWIGRREAYLRVRYEDFVKAPVATVERIASWAGARKVDTSFYDAGVAQLGSSHSVSGNPMRFHKGNVSIHLDDEWTRSLPALNRAAVHTICAPLMLRYSYR